MAVVTVKSTQITNRDATPRVLNSDYFDKGAVRESVGFVAMTSGDTSSSKYIFFQVPSNARLAALAFYSDALGTGTAGNLGLWDTTDNGSAVVSAALFASALSLASAIAGTNEQFQAGVTLISAPNAIDKRVWELLALSVDPQKMYDVVFQLSHDVTTTGNVAVKMAFVI